MSELKLKIPIFKRNEGTDDTERVPKGKNGGKFKTDNLDRDLDKYWGKDHKDHQETSKKCYCHAALNCFSFRSKDLK